MEKQLIKWLAENFDISRQETVVATFVYMHDLTTVSYGLLEQLTQFKSFDGIELRDNCLTVVVKKQEVDIRDLCVEAQHDLEMVCRQFSEGLVCSIEFINSVLDIAARTHKAADNTVCSNYHVCTDETKSCKCKLVRPKI